LGSGDEGTEKRLCRSGIYFKELRKHRLNCKLIEGGIHVHIR